MMNAYLIANYPTRLNTNLIRSGKSTHYSQLVIRTQGVVNVFPNILQMFQPDT